MKTILILILSYLFLSISNIGFAQTNIDLPIFELENINNDTIRAYDISEVDELPQYVGGFKQMWDFVDKNLQIPKSMGKICVEGKVYIGFIVEKDGTLTNIRVIKSVFEVLDNEALRVVKLMPKWIPAKIKGNSVRTQFYIIPIDWKY